MKKPIDWQPPEGWTRISVIDAHTGGEPFRVVTSGVPEIPGDTMLERRRYAREHLDTFRRVLMWEPRGHADMYGCYVTPPVTPGADLGVLFLHNEGLSTMCGHGIIALTKVALESGMVERGRDGEATVRIDSPAGLITAHARLVAGRVEGVRFENVASFAASLDQEVEVPGLGPIAYDLAFGGAFYAYVRAADAGLTGRAEDFRALIEAGTAIKKAVMGSSAITHPFEEDLGFLYGVIFTDDSPAGDTVHSRHVCVFADGEVDRCPTGTGVSARLALLHARGEIGIDETVTIDSIVGSQFTGRVLRTTTFGPQKGVIPEVAGTAYVTGRAEFVIDPSDPLRDGFILR
ncbi:MAG: proline racemase family protein [Thermoanaerobaculia bacterium]|nr:proline racemase family protein [Thermoanaerobaculia bacterium]